MCNFNNLIFFGVILLICASTGNCLKCYNCTTSDDKSGCDQPTVVEQNDTDSEKQVCLTIEYTRSNDSSSKFTMKKIFGLSPEKNITEACELFKNILNIAESVKVLQKEQVSKVMGKCDPCNTDLCNAPPASPQQPSSTSTPGTSSSSISIRLQQSSIGFAMAGIWLNFYKMHFL
ncbi:uncharacterized protein LOC135839968 [Planococcus citri]|uniref:uncharacterized protein LOC135839968 n=1 Tax=Planococcus citri TaxID=170843 RepID=UPI0031F9D323